MTRDVEYTSELIPLWRDGADEFTKGYKVSRVLLAYVLPALAVGALFTTTGATGCEHIGNKVREKQPIPATRTLSEGIESVFNNK